MSESQLQASIIEPLLRKLGFRQVQDTSGGRERGKDLIGILNEVGRDNLWSIQIKRFKVSSKAGAPESFGKLLDQLRQALQEPVMDISSGTRRRPDRCMFVTPYAISPNDIESFYTRYDEPIFRTLRIIDGAELLDLIETHIPEAMNCFSMELQYRGAVYQQTGRIRESPAAFELGRELELESIYVEANLGEGSDALHKIVSTPDLTESDRKEFARESARTRIQKDPYLVIAFEHEVTAASPHLAKWTRRPLIDLTESDFKAKRQRQIDVYPLVRAVKRRLGTTFAELATVPLPNTTIEECRGIATRAVKLETEIRQLRESAFVQRYIPALARPRMMHRPRLSAISIPSSSLLKVPISLYVTGPPGTGKTTLLRRLTQLTARDETGPIPLFIPLIKVVEPSYQGLLEGCRVALEANGYRIQNGGKTASTLESLFRKGAIRLCLDGLDERGVHAVKLMAAIEDLSDRFAKMQIILSCRDSFTKTREDGALSYWARALTVTLLPFTDDQLKEFVSKWFSAEPTSRAGLMTWFERNPHMKKAATTPLIAALLCSLFQIKTEMPLTELELYSRRIELLLGRWEKAKGIPPLRPDIRKRYEYFLMHLAYSIHLKEKRAVFQREALALAATYLVKGFHASSLAMLQDCIQRGVLEVDEEGQLSFGHLTYQEYLCGEWMAHHNPIDEILSVLDKPWWAKALEFYAARKHNITPLVEAASRNSSRLDQSRVLQLAELAPLTEERPLSKLREKSLIPATVDPNSARIKGLRVTF